MKNQYYKKDKKIRIVGRYTTQTPGGYPTARYRYLFEGSIWAYTRQLSQDQIFQAQAYGAEETRLFVINYRTDLKLYYIIEYKGEYYTITRLDSSDDYNTELYVYVSNTKPGDTPRDGEIEPPLEDTVASTQPIGVHYHGVHDNS